MSKRNLLNLSLLLFIIVLVILVIYEPGKQVALTPPQLTDLESNDIHHIKIVRRDVEENEREIEFKKTSGGWVMLKPHTVSANTFRLESILKILSTVSFSQNDLGNLNLNTFGLHNPVVSITFNHKTSLIFGHNESLNHHRYIQIGSTLHMTTDTFYYQLADKAESYINHKLLDEKSKLIRLTLPSIKLDKKAGRWHVKPEPDSFSADAINQLISEWQYSQAYDINKVKPDPESKPDITLQFENKKKTQFKIEQNKDSFNLVNIDTGIRYIFSADRKDKLLSMPNISQQEQ